MAVAAAIFVGLLIGILSGSVLLLLLRTASRLSRDRLSSILAIIAEILGIPVFWFCGTWLTTGLIQSLPRDPYIIALGVTFTALVVYPVYQWILRLASELGAETR